MNSGLKVGKAAHVIFSLFNKKPEWSAPETSNNPNIDINTAAKIIEKPIMNRHLVKHGTTRGIQI
ncbi:MAG: hypothetical protein LBI29_03195 [Rickettsiales bacterium]|jgi:hypothetical protein|nr:hypothetical protein [Rickettsiales bacterium]